MSAGVGFDIADRRTSRRSEINSGNLPCFNLLVFGFVIHDKIFLPQK